MGMHDLSQVWPDWQIEGSPLGAGSFGTVYKAVRRDNLVESYAAVKVISIPRNPSELASLRSEGLTTDHAVTSYLQGIVNDCVSEIQLMVSLKGVQNIVSVEDYKVIKKPDGIGWDIYIRMELLTPLTTYVARHRLTEGDIAKLGCDICTALEVCGKKGIIHRDIKPENIFVNDFGDFKLGDFGIARKLEGQMSNLSRKGTPNYMAPEVANSKDYDARVDTYSLGIVLYLYLNRNRLPFLNTEAQITSPVERENASNRRLRGEKLPAPSDASTRMAEIVLRACAYNPNARFQDATQMKQALQSILEAPPKKRRGVGKIITAIAIVLALLGSGVALFATGILPEAINKVVTVFTENKKDQDTPSDEDLDQQVQALIASIIAQADSLVVIQDYDGAIETLQAGLEQYPESIELQTKLNDCQLAAKDQVRVATLKNAKKLADANDYEGALEFLSEAISMQGEYPEYLAAYDTYWGKYEEIVVSEVLELVNHHVANGDILDAVTAIDEATAFLGENETLMAQRTELETIYVDAVVTRVGELILLEDYDTAEAMITEGLNYFPANRSLASENQRIMSSRPVYLLTEVSPYKKTVHYTNRPTMNMGGKSYTNGFSCMGYGNYNKGNQTYFNLDGKYSMISFTAGIISTRCPRVTFLFHADGELVYKFTMQQGDKPSNHVFNIVGCKQLQVSVYDNSSSHDKSGVYGLAEIKVKRNASAIDNGSVRPGENQVYLLNEVRPYKAPSHYEEASILNMGGKNFANGFSCMGYGKNNIGNAVYFNLDGNYSKMTFTAGIVLDRELDVVYRFYTDGKQVYEIKLGASDLPVTHSINVEGCKQLMISVYDRKSTPDVSGTYGIADIIMDKSSSYSKSTETKPLSAGEHYLMDVVKPHITPVRYDSNPFTMGGKHFTKGFSCMGYGDSKGNQTAFNLDGKYKQISFTSGIILDRDLNVTFRFFADGKRVYEFKMDAASLPTEHSFSVEGCSELVVSVYDQQRGADTSGTYGLGNIIVTE